MLALQFMVSHLDLKRIKFYQKNEIKKYALHMDSWLRSKLNTFNLGYFFHKQKQNSHHIWIYSDFCVVTITIDFTISQNDELNPLQLLQIGVRHPLPSLQILQGGEDEKRQRICE